MDPVAMEVRNDQPEVILTKEEMDEYVKTLFKAIKPEIFKNRSPEGWMQDGKLDFSEKQTRNFESRKRMKIMTSWWIFLW